MDRGKQIPEKPLKKSRNFAGWFCQPLCYCIHLSIGPSACLSFHPCMCALCVYNVCMQVFHCVCILCMVFLLHIYYLVLHSVCVLCMVFILVYPSVCPSICSFVFLSIRQSIHLFMHVCFVCINMHIVHVSRYYTMLYVVCILCMYAMYSSYTIIYISICVHSSNPPPPHPPFTKGD